MKNKLLITLFILIQQTVFAGGGSEGHSAGKNWDADNPWFLGDETASYCIEVSADTHYTRAELSQMVRESFDDWKKFFIKYNYDTLYLGDDGYKFKDGKKRRLTLDFVEIPTCNKPEEQLRIVFSKEPAIPLVQEAPSGLNLGAAIRGPYNHETYRTGGEVWIDNRSNNFRKVPIVVIKHIVLHELGHVFGMRHNETAVMHENAASLAYEKNSMLDGAYGGGLAYIELPGWKFSQPRVDHTIYFTSERVHSIEGYKPDKNSITGRVAFDFCEVLLNNTNKECALGVHLRFDGLTKSDTWNTKLFTLLLTANSKDGAQEKIELEGYFDPNESETATKNADKVAPGPGVATNWGPQGGSKRLSFFPLKPILPATGYFKYEGKKLPAVIEQGKGTTLKVFHPDKGVWFHWQGYEEGDWVKEEEI